MIIYKVTNLINNKIYIGQTHFTAEQRLRKHYSEAKSQQKLGKTSTYFHNALLKYGIENFKIEVIDTAVSDDELNLKEIEWIEKTNSQNRDIGYNEMSGGKSGIKNETVREKIRIKKLENWSNPEIADRMSKGLSKATETWKTICKEKQIEIHCAYCGTIFKVAPYEEKFRKFCSQKCANAINIQKATIAAALKKKETTKESHDSFRKEILIWGYNNYQKIKNCPRNKISTTLIEIVDIAKKYNIIDWRSICNAICGNSSKKELLNYLLVNCEKIC